MACDLANRTGVVEWPPSAEILEAAGGIGFGSIHLATQAGPSKISTEDVVVPPVIRSLHPKLAAEGYARHRRDPLFLYKVLLAMGSTAQRQIWLIRVPYQARHMLRKNSQKIWLYKNLESNKHLTPILANSSTAEFLFNPRRLSFARAAFWCTLSWPL